MKKQNSLYEKILHEAEIISSRTNPSEGFWYLPDLNLTMKNKVFQKMRYENGDITYEELVVDLL
jgi:hypothetical protein